MSDRKIRDKVVSDEQAQAWADEAEAGYDPETISRYRDAYLTPAMSSLLQDRDQWRAAALAAEERVTYLEDLLVEVGRGDLLR